MTQTYTDPVALTRMAQGRCPECGYYPGAHGGLGGPNGCLLTDNGVAQRLAAYAEGTGDAMLADAAERAAQDGTGRG